MEALAFTSTPASTPKTRNNPRNLPSPTCFWLAVTYQSGYVALTLWNPKFNFDSVNRPHKCRRGALSRFGKETVALKIPQWTSVVYPVSHYCTSMHVTCFTSITYLHTVFWLMAETQPVLANPLSSFQTLPAAPIAITHTKI